MKKYFLLLILLHIFTFGIIENTKAQNRQLFINEILVYNDSNYIDDYGERHGWIEIFNSDYNSVEVGGMYITNDSTNPTKYWIPTGDPRTLIPPRNFIVFHADDKETRGILHLNFTLDKSNYIALYDVNGRTKIDEIKYGEQYPDISYGRVTDGVPQFDFLEKTTPKARNYYGKIITKSELFEEVDPSGIGMSIVAMSIVFVALILLYILFKNTKFLYSINLKNIFKKSEKEKTEQKVIQPVINDIPGEVNAAISLALSLYVAESHDEEDAILTIKKVARTYSPWSSKIYGLTQNPRK